MLFPSKLPISTGDLYTLSNTWFLGSTGLSIANGISIGSAVFAQLMAETPYTLTMGTCLKIALPIRGSRPHIIQDSLGSFSSQLKWHLDWFNHFARMTAVSLYFTMGCPFPLKIAHSHGGMWTPSNTWFLAPTQVLNPNGISIGHFSGLTSVTHRLTDRSCYLVGNTRPNLHTWHCDVA